MSKRGFNIKGVFVKYTKDLGVKVDTAINKYTHKQKDTDNDIKKGYIDLTDDGTTRIITIADKDVIREFIKSEFDLGVDGVITVRGYNALKKLYKNHAVDELTDAELSDVLDYIDRKNERELSTNVDRLDELYIELGFNEDDSDDEELDLSCLDDESIDWDDELIGFDDELFDWDDDTIDWD